jgi:carbon monoxide dehydrogenase subunit G
MDLTHRFTVPVPIDEAWAHFNDIGSVAECFPGASVTSAEGDTFAGSVKVKLGPIALVYNGTGTFTEKDEAAHRMVVDAKGKDKRGNGTAGAAVVMTMTESPGAGTSTDIEVVTDLAITGKPAQFGRGVMQDVSDKLLGQFVACLEQRFQGAGGAEADVPEVAAVAEVPEAPAAPVPPAAEPDATLTDEAAPAAVEVPPPGPAAAAAPAPAAPAAAVAGQRKKDDDALNLGTTVLPILVKSYWKQALAALVVLAIIIWLITRL